MTFSNLPVVVDWSDQVAVATPGQGGPTEVFFKCDDCGEAYLGPAYYTFETSACSESIGDVIPKPHVGCTGNICPDCADFLEPDDEDDPRRQELTYTVDPATGMATVTTTGVRP